MILNRLEVVIIRISLADLIGNAERVLGQTLVHLNRRGPWALGIVHHLNLTPSNLDGCYVLVSLARD